jgi:hypothetical protein
MAEPATAVVPIATLELNVESPAAAHGTFDTGVRS